MDSTSECFRVRLGRLREFLDEQSAFDALLVSDLSNIRWLTGLSSSNAVAVVLPSRLVVITDARYHAQALATPAESDVVVSRSLASTALECADAECITRIGVDLTSMSAAAFAVLSSQAAELGITPVECRPVIPSLRARKDSAEVTALTEACEVSISALSTLIDEFEIGISEVKLARRLEMLMAEFGGDDRAFPSIVAAGPHSAIPHHEPTTRPIQFGDVLKVDFGALVEGYHADCTRTFVVGAEPTPLHGEVHAAVDAAAAAARAVLEPGIEVAEVDRAARAVLIDAGFDDRFTHGLGHGVGLEIHEAPLIAKDVAGTIPNGAVVTIEPGVYLPGVFGVRIEDTCHVTADGVKILTDFPRELARIG